MTALTPRTSLSYADGALLSWGTIEREQGFTDYTSLAIHVHDTDPLEFVFWNGHQFETVQGRYAYTDKWGLRLTWKVAQTGHEPHEYVARLYFPIDKRMEIDDIAGARIAYPNESNTGWLFAHCDRDFHIDHEYRLLAAVTTAFEAEQARSEKIFRDSIYDCFLVNDRGNQAAVTAFNRMSNNLNLFREDVKTQLLKTVRTHHLGYYQQNPHDAHVHAPLETAIRAVIPKWQSKSTQLLDWIPISTYVNGVLARVSERHTYETRWDEEARIESEKKAATDTESEET